MKLVQLMRDAGSPDPIDQLLRLTEQGAMTAELLDELLEAMAHELAAPLA